MNDTTTNGRWRFAGIADGYEKYLASAFAMWTPEMFDMVALSGDDRLLDVACGTGIVARLAAARRSGETRIAGVDADAGMLETARAVSTDVRPAIEWHQADASDLPFDDASFDVALCQQGLQFMPDRPAAIREMHRVLGPGGRVGIAVWRPIGYTPGEARLADALGRQVGAEAEAMLHAPFVLGDPDELRGLLRNADFVDVRIRYVTRTPRYPSAAEFVRREVVSWLAGAVGEFADDTRDALVADVAECVREYTDDEGVCFPMATQIAIGRRV